MGLEAIKEGTSVDVGDAIPVFEVQATGPGGSVGDRLGEPQTFLVPVRSDGEVVSAVTMRRGATGSWEVVTVGRVGLARSVERVHARLSAEGHDEGLGLVMVHDPEVRLLVREQDGRRVFTALGPTAAQAGLPAEEDVEQVRVDDALRATVH
jgi:hypothetical protein